jgi:hypothetical protein
LKFSLIEIHTITIDRLLDQYEQDIEQIKYEFRQERARIIRDHDISKTELQDIIYNMEKSFLDAETAAEQNFQANMEELRNKYREDMQQYQLNVESRSTALQNEMTTITTNYRERTRESKAQYQEYKMKDEKNSKEIRDATIYINRITVNDESISNRINAFFFKEKINGIKSQIAALEANHQARMNKVAQVTLAGFSFLHNIFFLQEKESMKQYLLQLKSQLIEMQDELRRRLKNLASTCDTVEKQLEKRVKIAETILTFAEMCRKLEAEEEKILPFYASTLTDEERAEVQAAFYEQPFEDLAKVFFLFFVD